MLFPFRRRLTALNRIEVKSEQIQQNFQVLRELLPEKQIFPVLKGNAYGHGIELMAKILRPLDFPYFVVDSYYEALKIQKVAPEKKILIIGYNLPENYQHFDFRKIAVVVYDLAALEALSKIKKPIRIHLKINTGLNRQGIAPAELPKYLEQIAEAKNLELEGVCSHFADADNPENDWTRTQEQIFAECLDVITAAGFAPKFIHLANTAGSLKTTDPRINSFRFGIGLYGYNPLLAADPHFAEVAQLRPALRLISTLVNIHEIKKGEKVGYNGIFTAPHDMRIGVVPVGYYECLPRTLSNTGFVRIQEETCPIVGKIHMNLTCFNLRNIAAKIGEAVEVISPNSAEKNSIENIARTANTISYEILVHLSETIRRLAV